MGFWLIIGISLWVLATGLFVIRFIQWQRKKAPTPAAVDENKSAKKTRKGLNYLVVIALIIAAGWLGSALFPKKVIVQTPAPAPKKQALPFARVKGKIEKISPTEVIITMNGSEGMIDTGLVVNPGQKFTVEQIEFDEAKKNRITVGYYGKAAPIWGGYASMTDKYRQYQRVKYDINGAINGVVVVLQNNEGKEDVLPFDIGRTKMSDQTELESKILLYYNGMTQLKKDGRWHNVYHQNGWDGSTATFRINIDK